MKSLGRDLRYGLRGLWRNSGFSLVAVLTLALAIGANATIFSLIDQAIAGRHALCDNAGLARVGFHPFSDGPCEFVVQPGAGTAVQKPALGGINQAASGTAAGGSLKFRRTCVVLQVAFSLLLMVAAGLFVRTIDHLRHVDTGLRLTICWNSI